MRKSKADLNIVFNLAVFLQRFHAKKPGEAKLTPLDAWMISRMNSTIKEFRACFEGYELNRAAKALRNFIVEDVSRFYMKMAKERISSGQDAEGALYALYHALLASLKMLGCFSPMLSESLYQQFFRKFEAEESLFFLKLEPADDAKINALAEKQMETVKEVVSIAMVARQKAGIKVRWPIRTLYLETKSHEAADSVNAFRGTLLALMNAKELKTVEAPPAGDLASEAFSNGTVHIEKKMDEALYEEGMVNEVKRRVQIMRKDAQLVEHDRIHLSISCEKELEAILKKHEARLLGEVNAAKVDYEPHKTMNEYEIDGRLVKLALKKMEK
jgi:isoleucyl-tRNA synthetase